MVPLPHGYSTNMPRPRPPTSGYARLSQADNELGSGYQDYSDDDDLHPTSYSVSSSAPQYAPIQPQPNIHMQLPSDGSTIHRKRPASSRRRVRSNSSGVDIKAINARLEKWAGEIASKFKINKVKGKSPEEEHLEIHYSVFQPPDGVRPATAETLHSDATIIQEERLTKLDFDDVVESVRIAIELGIHPKMISQGSSGSYFARDSDEQVVGVFKPKDEEPYASRNPKWTKWIHRNLFPCFFGRECLIPNLSYVSEAAAYVLDSRLRTNLVPYTDIVHLSSKSFYYDFWQRSAFYRKRKPLPEKVGSFQVFLKGFKDANIFLREHPWPDQTNTGFRPQDAPKRKRPWVEDCRPRGAQMDDEDKVLTETRPSTADEEGRPQRFFWTDALQESFREELEKLVVLDYIMRNTDRGLDNWMIKVDWRSQEVSITTEPPQMNGNASTPSHHISNSSDGTLISDPYRRQEIMMATSRSATPLNGHEAGKSPSITIGAIDNSLSWPWKHPDAWRSFPFGWLFLPVSLIGQPFSQKTRDHFLPLLTSTEWWSETQLALRRIFSQDADFKERMFARQIAVMKGQAWNVVETLKTRDHGPLELTRRARVCVWDDLVDIPVAIPLRTPSAEMRRRTDISHRSMEEEEMDISAVNGPLSKDQQDLLRNSPPSLDLPNPNRFELSRNANSSDLAHRRDGADAIGGGKLHQSRESISDRAYRPYPVRTRTRASDEGVRKPSSMGSHRRTHSFSTRYGNSPFLYNGDDLEGDLGYAAAEGMEGNRRKVIVERLETVKSKNPVFSWC